MIRDRPDLGVLPAEVDALRATLAALAPRRAGGATSLTVAELRVLALLPYYLSFKEIGQRLGVKETTIKSQALAIYDKLGAATRSDAVDLAVDAGLLERFWPVTAALPPRRAPSGSDGEREDRRLSSDSGGCSRRREAAEIEVGPGAGYDVRHRSETSPSALKPTNKTRAVTPMGRSLGLVG